MSNFTAQRTNVPTITQSLAVGNIEATGTDAQSDGSSRFNDAVDATIGNWPYVFNIDRTHPIEKIQVQFRTNYIDGLTVTYRLLDDGSGQSGSSAAIQHGAKFTATESTSNTVTFSENEILLSVTGRAGTNSSNLNGIFEITFVKFDTATGAITPQTFGTDDTASVFYASGPIFAFAGNQINTATQLGLETLSFISPYTRGSRGVNLTSEIVRDFDSYSDASKFSCSFVNSGKAQVQTSDLELFESRLSRSPAYGKVVGVGIKRPSGTIIPLVRLDTDNSGKGIHFNAVSLSDASQKLAACLKRTKEMSEADRNDLYMQYIKGLENRSPQFIWNWWTTGADLGDVPNFVPANVNIASGVVNVNTADGHNGTGWVGGIGAGLSDVTGGVLGYGSWDTLKSAQNIITIVAELDVLTITFIVDGAVAAVFIGDAIGEVTLEGVGVFNWS